MYMDREEAGRLLWEQKDKCAKCGVKISYDTVYPLPYGTFRNTLSVKAGCKSCWEQASRMVIETVTYKFWRNMSPEDIKEHDKQYTEVTDDVVRKTI